MTFKKIKIIFSLFIVLFSYSNTIQAQSAENILKDNAQLINTLEDLDHKKLDIENNDYYSSFSIIDEAIKGKKVFFLGEDHRYRISNSELLLKTLKYLNQEIGLNHLIIEQGKSAGLLADKYVNTGKDVYKEFLSNYTYPSFYDFFIEIEKYNKNLPDSSKIRIHGIDMERSIPIAFKALGMLIPANDPPKDIIVQIETIKGMEGYFDHYFSTIKVDSITYDLKKIMGTMFFDGMETIKGILEEFDDNKAIYKTYLENDYEDFNDIIIGLKNSVKWYDYQEKSAYQEWVIRENYMHDRFTELFSEFPEGKFIGSFGRCHTSLNIADGWCDLYSFKSLANRINNEIDTALKNSVLTIGSYYPNSRFFNKKKSDAYVIRSLSNLVKQDEVVLFKVDEDSIFNNVKGTFDFVVINKRKIENEKKMKNISLEIFDEEEDPLLFHIDFSLLQSNYDFSSLNQSLTNNDFSKVNNGILFYTFGLQLNVSRTALAWNYRHMPEITIDNINNNNSVIFKIRDYNFDFYQDFIGSPKTNLMLGIRNNFGSVNLTEVIKDSESVFNNSTSSSYTSEIWNLGGIFQFRYNFKYISIGTGGGYLFDIWDKNFQAIDGNDISENVTINTSNWFWNINLSLVFSSSL